MIPPVSVVHDNVTKEVIPESASGMCQACWENYYNKLEQPWLELDNALRRLLLTEAELEMIEPPTSAAAGIERMYPLQWKHPKEGEDLRVWLVGPSVPMSKADLQEFFRRQIALAKRGRAENRR